MAFLWNDLKKKGSCLIVNYFYDFFCCIYFFVLLHFKYGLVLKWHWFEWIPTQTREKKQGSPLSKVIVAHDFHSNISFGMTCISLSFLYHRLVFRFSLLYISLLFFFFAWLIQLIVKFWVEWNKKKWPSFF